MHILLNFWVLSWAANTTCNILNSVAGSKDLSWSANREATLSSFSRASGHAHQDEGCNNGARQHIEPRGNGWASMDFFEYIFRQERRHGGNPSHLLNFT